MAVNVLNTTTLSEALSKDAIEFAVASTTNISVGQYLVISGTAGLEAMKVQAIPVSGRVGVIRGQGGTRALAAANGTRLYIGSPADYQGVKDGVLAGVNGNPGNFGDYLLPGLRYRDGAGNEYVLVELTATVVPGTGVLFSKDGNFTAAPLTSAGFGSVGVVIEDGTSDQYVWAQVYGACRAKFVGGSSLATSTGVVQGASSVSTPAVGLLAQTTSQASSNDALIILGMYLSSAVTTATTSATSETGFAANVWLHYPFLRRNTATS